MSRDAPTRVLDIDLDFFLDSAANFRPFDADRLDPDDYAPWGTDRALTFLRERCQLGGKLPGFVVENHGDLFAIWREAIDSGLIGPRLSITHVDAHADLGLGETDHRYLLTDLLHRAPERRLHPRVDRYCLTDGTFLAFSVACRWVTEITHVFNVGDGSDVHPFLMEGFDPLAGHVHLAALTEEEFAEVLTIVSRPAVTSSEPRVPYRRVSAAEFKADERFDIVCLTRSPAYTPPTADPLLEQIRREFIDEIDTSSWALQLRGGARADWF